jgi:TRAP-type C4-dicarboxylate transport system permease large subunit
MLGIRVLAAIVLASLLRESDGSVFWAQLVPSLLTCGAVIAVAVAVVRRRRDHGAGPPVTS